MTRRLSLLLTTLTLPILFIGTLIYVGSTRAGTYDICNSGCTYGSIQEAVTNGPENTPMTIGPGTYSENVEIIRSVRLVGAGPDLTIIDGQMTDTVILINSGPTVSISGVTIQNGDASLDGGGLLIENGTVTLSDSVVQNNLALSGAGIANNGSLTLDDAIVRNNTADEVIGPVSICGDCAGGGILNFGVMTLTNSTIHGNTANFGGGIDNAFMGTLVATGIEVYGNSVSNNTEPSESFGGGIENLNTMTLTDSIVRDNSAPFGGGIYTDGNLTVSDSDLYGNMATTRGGGIHNSFGLTVQTSNIYNNEAGSGGGGGISSEGGDVVVERTAVYNNSATGSGGGIVYNVPMAAGDNKFFITNSTISGNSTSGSGGGLRNAGIANTTLNNVTISNNSSIVAAGQSVSVVGGALSANNSIINGSNLGGARTNCSGTLSSNGYNIANDGSCGLNGTADLPNTNPLLDPLQNNGGGTLTHALLVGSPAIDSGNGCPAVDQRGTARPFGAECDRGAYEFDMTTQSIYLPFVIRP